MDIRSFFNGTTKKSSTSTPKAKPVESVAVEPVVKDQKLDNVSEPVILSQLNQTSVTESSENSMSSQPIPKNLEKLITWKNGERVPYSAVAETFNAISATSSRLEKESLLAKLFRAISLTSPSDLDSVVYLASNKIFPAYEGLELGIGDALLIKAVVEATGRNKNAVQEAYKNEGDLGIVASQSRSSQSMLSFGAKPKALAATYVLEQLRLITRTIGNKSMDRKVDVIKKMMVACQGDEAKYLIRALQGKLRIGTAAQTVLVGLAHAIVYNQYIGQNKDTSTTITEDEVEDAMDVIENSDEEGERKDTLESKKPKEIIVSTLDTGADGGEVKGEPMDTNETDNLQTASTPKDLLQLIEQVDSKLPYEAVKLKKLAETKYRSSMLDELKHLSEVAVKRAFSECPNISVLVAGLLNNPIYDLHQCCRLTPGIPVAPMLAKPTKAVADVLKRLSGLAFTMEFKYDGERAQIHLLADGSIKIFSRNSEDLTLKYPDLMDSIRSAKDPNVFSFVVDAEVVAYDREKQCLMPFQILSTRKRKVEVGEEDNQKVKVILQVFDMLYLNGKSLLQEPLLQRRTLLHNSFSHTEGLLHFATGQDHVENGDTTPIELFMQEACSAMCEGLMVKTLSHNATYEPSKRSLNWLKLKKDYIEGMGVCDSVDLVPIGGYHGRGKRTNVYGAYLMACYDPDSDEFQSVCKVGTGFKDEDLIRLTELTRKSVVTNGKKPQNYNVGDPLTPDEWFEPSVVWELQAADLSKSSVHKGGIGKIEAGRGIGLRFPRFLRERPDKSPETATTAEQIVDMYQSQDGVEGANDADDDDDDLL